MEAMRQRIIQAYENKEFLKIIFNYPSANRATIKRGLVIEVFDDGFTLEEIIDGKVTYSYEFISEIKCEGDYNECDRT
jgi:hypothetical protein